jgi:polyisoprenoid-binding protein YceI
MQGNRRIGFSATTSISRKDWGLNWNATLEAGGVLVSDHIYIQIEAQIYQPQQAPAQTTT